MAMDFVGVSDFWARFSIAFSWDYPEGWDIQAVQSAVFHVVGEDDTRVQDQLVCGCVQSAGAGVTLSRPHPESELIPCEMSFTAHPMSEEFCIKNIVIVSEARNIEMYIDDNYEKTAKGIMLTIRKGRKLSLFETEFDLSGYIQGNCKCVLKFVSYAEENCLRLQTVVVRVARCGPTIPSPMVPTGADKAMKALFPNGQQPMDLSSVRSYLDSMGKPLTAEAEKLLANMEQMQAVRSMQQAHQQPRPPASELSRSSSIGSLHSIPRKSSTGSDSGILASAISRARQLEEEDKNERHQSGTPDPTKDEGFVNMLAQLMVSRARSVDSLHIAQSSKPLVNGIDSSEADSQDQAQSRWEAYLQSRVRASRNIARRSRPNSFVSNSGSSTSATQVGTGLGRRGQSAMCLNYEERPPMQKSLSAESVPTEKETVAQLTRPLEILPSHPVHPAQTTQTTTVSTAGQDGGKKRCGDCGCPGCLSVYNSITTNIYAAEERIMGRVENKMQKLLEHIDTRFDILFQTLQSRQETLYTETLARAQHDLFNSLPRNTASRAQNGKMGNTPV